MNSRIGGKWDSGIYVWSIAWWKYALFHHVNPFITNYIWYPTGFNAARATTVPGLFLLTLPIQLLWGESVAFNVMYMFMPGLAAATMFLLCYHLVRQFWPSLLAGMLFGFSGYMVAQTTSHLNLTAGVFLMPLVILLTVWLIECKITKGWFIAGCSICLVLLFLITIEVFFTFTVASGIAAMLAILFFREQRYRLLQAMPMVMLAYGVTAVIVSPYLYYFFTDSVSGNYANVESGYTNDLLSFFIPTKLYGLKTSGMAQFSSRWAGNAAEKNAYLGVPLLLILLFFIKQHWSKYYAKYLLILFLIFAVISLGGVIRIAGIDVLPLLPIKLFFSMPLLKWSLPSRFSLYASFVVSLIVVYWLAQARSRWAAFLLVLLALVFLMPTRNLRDYPRYTQFNNMSYPPFFSKESYRHWLVPGESVMIIPFSSYGVQFPVAAYYQAKSGFYFKMINGMSGKPIPLAFHDRIIGSLVKNAPAKISPENMLRFLKLHHMDHLIILDREYNRPPWQAALSKIKVVPVHTGGVWLYDLSSLYS